MVQPGRTRDEMLVNEENAPQRISTLRTQVQQLEAKLQASEKIIRTLLERVEHGGSAPLDVTGARAAAHVERARAEGGDVMASAQEAERSGEQRLNEALDELKRTQAKLLQAQKLEAIGQLAAGIAHEINTPTQYVADNTTFLQRAFTGLMSIMDAFDPVVAAAEQGLVDPALLAEVLRAANAAKLPYLRKQVPRAIEQAQEGLHRISSIVLAMKEFSHPSGSEKHPVNVHEVIETTATIARNEWKYVADLELDFDTTLPPVPLLRNEFNQVILNLIVNAAHAIGAATKDGATGKGRIRVSTRHCDEHVEIRVSDTGTGIPERIRPRMFEPFFTTKPVGKGTGQGLAIAYSVVVDKHRGTIHYETEEGRGTTFVIRLPLNAEDPSVHEVAT